MSGLDQLAPVGPTEWALIGLAFAAVTIGKFVELCRTAPPSGHLALMALAHAVPMVAAGVGFYLILAATASFAVKAIVGAVLFGALILFALGLRKLIRNDDAVERESMRAGPPAGAAGIEKVTSDPA